jgi:hypothetical protein
MKPTFLGSNGAAGSVLLSFSLTNTESATCHTYGWPRIEFLSTAGAVLGAEASDSKKTLLQAPTPVTVVNLAPGQKAYLRVLVSGSESGAKTCAKATEMALTVPYDTLAQNVAIPGGVPVCGAITVSPLLPRYIADAAG